MCMMAQEIKNADSIITKVFIKDSRIFKDTNKGFWEQLYDESEYKRNVVEEYRNKKFKGIPTNPICDYMDDNVFFVLNGILEATLNKARDTNSLKYQKSPFNAIDFIAEQLWNLNPNYPDRGAEYVSIHDMEWAKKIMNETPRPRFPFSYIWSKHFAAMKIQAYMRGYWVRKREAVHEMREFWKAIQLENKQCFSRHSFKSNI